MKVVAFLPAKGTSERIPSKNMKKLNGKPLFFHTLQKLCNECEFIDEVYLDSDSDEILNFAPYLKYTPLKRNPVFASNETDGHQMFYNEICQVDADIYIQILCTSPFIKPSTIKKGLDILVSNSEYDSVVLMKKEKQYLWKNNKPVYDINHIPNSKDLPDTIIESMGLYIVKKKAAFSKKMRYGDHVYMLFADAEEAVDVNYADEFMLADTIMKGINEKENRMFDFISPFLSSSLFSDILSERKINNVIPNLISNFPDRKVMGRANTLKLRSLKKDEDYRGIYDGLKTYEWITPGEIIVVENAIEKKAYFGDLNASLALRSGAKATIIGGVTRDIDKVTKLGYPVYSKGYCCSDVKYFATVDGYQIPITISGVNINPGDIIFADSCGVVCIPRVMENDIIQNAINTAITEQSILSRILNKESAMDIYLNEGEF